MGDSKTKQNAIAVASSARGSALSETHERHPLSVIVREPAVASPGLDLNQEASTEPPERDRISADFAPDRYNFARRRVGKVLDGKWKLDSLLGVGGMAVVYAATHRNGARAAIKLLPFSVSTGPELCQRLLREGYLANKINHPAVVRVLDDQIDYDKEHAYIVMELLEGETARQRLERVGPLEPLKAVELMSELCDCLRAAHKTNIVHRDIKPENLFLTENGLKVLDFGIARALDGNSSLTQTGTSLGTPAYMSPEQARGKQGQVNERSDLYSVGATLLFLLSGETLHEGEGPMELMVRAAWTPPPRAKKKCPDLPNVIAELIDRCCAFDPKDRFSDADTLAAALERVRANLSSSPPPPLSRLMLSPPTQHETPEPAVDYLAETLSIVSLPKRQTKTWLTIGGGLLLFGIVLIWSHRAYNSTPESANSPPIVHTSSKLGPEKPAHAPKLTATAKAASSNAQPTPRSTLAALSVTEPAAKPGQPGQTQPASETIKRAMPQLKNQRKPKRTGSNRARARPQPRTPSFAAPKPAANSKPTSAAQAPPAAAKPSPFNYRQFKDRDKRSR